MIKIQGYYRRVNLRLPLVRLTVQGELTQVYLHRMMRIGGIPEYKTQSSQDQSKLPIKSRLLGKFTVFSISGRKFKHKAQSQTSARQDKRRNGYLQPYKTRTSNHYQLGLLIVECPLICTDEKSNGYRENRLLMSMLVCDLRHHQNKTRNGIST